MTVLPIYVAPHPVLKTKGEPVNTIDPKTRKLMDDMLETMYANDGIGLAAPQVGVSTRVIVMDLEQNPDAEGAEKKGAPRFFVNPEIVWSSEEMRSYNEGCLSIPGQYADVERPDRVRVKYLDYDGKTQEEEVGGLFSTCIQHEIDHIDGVLFIDHLTSLKRDMLMRKLKKFTRDNAEEMAQSHVIL